MSPVPVIATRFVEIPLHDLERGAVAGCPAAPPTHNTSKPSPSRTGIFFQVLIVSVLCAFVPTVAIAILLCIPSIPVGAYVLGRDSPAGVLVHSDTGKTAAFAGIAAFILLPTLLGGLIYAAIEVWRGKHDDKTDEERNRRLLAFVYCVMLFAAVQVFFFYPVGGLLVNAVAAARHLPSPLSRAELKYLLVLNSAGVATILAGITLFVLGGTTWCLAG